MQRHSVGGKTYVYNYYKLYFLLI